MLSYQTPASILRQNAEGDRIMTAKGHGVDRNAPTPGKAKTDAFEASLQARKQG